MHTGLSTDETTDRHGGRLRTARLGLGTVQFGLDYAIDAAETQPSPEDVARILALARSAAVSLLDTASAYGTAEEVLGRALRGSDDFRIVTKTATFDADVIRPADAETLTAVFRQSLGRLGRPSVYGLMVHKAANLLAEGGEYLFEALVALRRSGLVKKIGVSVYDAAQIESLTTRYPLELVQAPVSILDQRLIAGGQLSALKELGIEIHARSAFLKGLVFADPARLPRHFDSSKPALLAFREAAREHSLSLQAAALNFLLDRAELDTVLCGVTGPKQLEEILAAARGTGAGIHALPEPARFALTDPDVLNPALWPDFRI